MTAREFPHDTAAELAATLAEICDVETLAGVLNCTLGAEADPRLTDDRAELAGVLFDQLAARRPDAVAAAMADPNGLQGAEPPPADPLTVPPRDRWKLAAPRSEAIDNYGAEVPN